VRSVDAVLQPGLGDHQDGEVERVERPDGENRHRTRVEHCGTEAQGRCGEQGRERAVGQPTGPLGERGAGRPRQRDAQDGERHGRDRHATVGRQHREVLLDSVQATDQADREDGEPQGGTAQRLDQGGTDRSVHILGAPRPRRFG
jgi:hypothetical protein